MEKDKEPKAFCYHPAIGRLRFVEGGEEGAVSLLSDLDELGWIFFLAFFELSTEGI